MLRPVLAGAVLLAAIALSGCMPEEPASPSQTPVSSATIEASPTPTADAGDTVSVPATCEDLVPAGQREALDYLELNTAESQNAGLPPALSNPDLDELVEDNRVLACVWTGSDPAKTFLSTSVVRIDGGEGARAVAGLRADKVDCVQENEGTRCQFVNRVGKIDTGETHFFRDDVWISTAWSNVAPPGYTASLVDTLWP